MSPGLQMPRRVCITLLRWESSHWAKVGLTYWLTCVFGLTFASQAGYLRWLLGDPGVLLGEDQGVLGLRCLRNFSVAVPLGGSSIASAPAGRYMVTSLDFRWLLIIWKRSRRNCACRGYLASLTAVWTRPAWTGSNLPRACGHIEPGYAMVLEIGEFQALRSLFGGTQAALHLKLCAILCG